jgi:hypothetical protein
MLVTKIVIISVLIVISGISKAVQDKIQFHFYESRFKKLGTFWNPELSWENKWKDGDPKKGERFPGSSTIFVSLTDAWHLFGLIRNISLVLCIPVISGVWWLIFLYPVFFGTFHTFFTWVFSKKS